MANQTTDKNIKIINWNSNGINTRWDELEIFMQKHQTTI